MKLGDTIICYRNLRKDGEKLLTKGQKYYIHMGDYTYEGENRFLITTTTNKEHTIFEFFVHKPTLIERIIKRIELFNVITIYPTDRKYFSDYFHTEKDIRKLKLKKLNKKKFI